MTSESPVSRKRSRDDHAATNTCTLRRTRTKLSPPTDIPSTSTSASSYTSALVSTSVPEESTAASSQSPSASSSSSELSESSEDPSDESSEEESESDSESTSDIPNAEDEDGVINIRANRGKKPTFKLRKADLGPDLRPFLKDFLPQLKAANEELEAERKAGTLKSKEIDAGEEGMEDAGSEEKQYVEMNLGLGVLEEKDPNASDLDSDGEGATGERDVLGKLLGRESKDITIQEVEDAVP